jgi:rhodanese-related sulfurtransferase
MMNNGEGAPYAVKGVAVKKYLAIAAGLAVLLGTVLYLQARPKTVSTPAPLQASGTIVQGYRILPVGISEHPIQLVVFRGDYIKFDVDPSIRNPHLKIPALSIDQQLDRDPDRAPFFKMKMAGQYAFTLGEAHGHIEVVAYQQTHYAEVDSRDAAEFIAHAQPLVLDVRTPAEFKRGHLQGATLIPVQELQKRLAELQAHKERNILVYCATGNRSTVASKILIDNGFQRITNMRYGIAGWVKEKFPIAR